MDEFEKLGRPENAGMAFCITRLDLVEKYGSVVSNIPVPSYEHGLFHDPVTDNYLVIRPDANGVYDTYLNRVR